LIKELWIILLKLYKRNMVKISLKIKEPYKKKLKREVEKTKRALSNTHEAKIEIEGLIDGLDFTDVLTRARFEELNNDLFKKTLGPV